MTSKVVATNIPWTKLENLEKQGYISFLRGSGISKKDFDEKGAFPCIHYGDLYTAYQKPEIIEVVHRTNFDGKVRSHVGDVLIPATTTADEMGIAIARAINKKGVVLGSDINILRTENKYLLSTYLSYIFNYGIKRELASYAKGTNILHLSNKDIKKLSIPVPSLPEQKRIVEKLDKIFGNIDKAKEKTTHNLKNVQEVFEARMDSILKPHSDWHNVKMSEVCDVRDGTHDSPKYIKSGFPLVTSKNLKNGTLVFDNIKYICQEDYDHINERSKVDIGDVLFAMIGTIGNPVVVTEEPRYAIKNMALFKHSKEILPSFLKYILESRVVLDKMQKEANGTTQKFVSLGYLRNFIISLPSIKQQSDIIKELDSLRTKTQELEKIYTKKLADLDELKQSVLQQAFSGKL